MSVAVCIVVKDNFHATKYCIENLLAKCKGLPVELFIYDNGSTDERIREYCRSVAKVFHPEGDSFKISIAYNRLFKMLEAKHDFVCLFPSDILVSENWLTDLHFYLKTIDNSGIVAIKSGRENVFLTPLLVYDSEETKLQWVTNNEFVSGVCLFRKEILNEIGGMDMKLNATGYEMEDFCYRVTSGLAKRNFYITKQESVRTGIIAECNNPKKEKDGSEKFKINVNYMSDTAIYKKQL